MNERFKVAYIFITPIYDLGNGNFRRDFEYPFRACVIDTYQGIAIDIKTKLKYDYIETMSYLYTRIMKDSYKKIKEGIRLAVCNVDRMGKLDFDLEEAEDIKKKLENGYKFLDGNDIYDNEQYLSYIEKEPQIEEQKILEKNSKVKKTRKKRK